MDYVDRQAKMLIQQRCDAPRGPLDVRNYAKLAREIDGVSEDIQSLSRFVILQRQAFRKILKKYRKWTGTSSLEHRTKNKIFDQPASMLQIDFTPLLDRLEAVKATLAAFARPPIAHSHAKHKMPQQVPPPSSSQPSKSTASQLHHFFLYNSPLEFDATFSFVPLGVAGGRATYWAHDDNLEEAMVLMRRYMRPRTGLSTPSAMSRANSYSSLSLAQRDGAQPPSWGNGINMLLCDNLQRYLRSYGAVTVGQTEAVVGSVSSMIAMTVSWADQPEAVVVTSDLSPPAEAVHRRADIATIESKSLTRSFATKGSMIATAFNANPDTTSESNGKLQTIRDWLAQHRDVKPLAQVQSSRSRFAGLNNTNEVGTWALVDQDVNIRPASEVHIGSSSMPEGEGALKFPHTIIEVRWEFSRTPEIVRALDNTHLVERVRGFSLEAQAISMVCKTPASPPPIWQSLLEQDIRKVPPVQVAANLRRQRSAVASSGQSSTDQPRPASSTTATQSTETSPPASGRSSPSLAPIKVKRDIMPEKQQLHPFKPPRKSSQRRRPKTQRYWNEFDNGDERHEEAYSIYVNPDEGSAIPGVQAVAKALSKIYHSLNHARTRLITWSPIVVDENRDYGDIEDGLGRPLIGSWTASSNDEGDESSDSEPAVSRRPRRYSTPYGAAADYGSVDRGRVVSSRSCRRHAHGRAHPSREVALFRTYLGCYAFAVVLLVMSSIMQATGRHKARMEVNAGVIVGVIAAFGAAIVAISLMMSREERLSWLHRGLGVGGFFAILAWGAWLAFLLGSRL